MANTAEKISRIRTGGQSGADRAAMDFARENGIVLCGWCPKNGWAEDYPDPPGLLKDYPELTETPSEDTALRTKWNMRDCDAILTIIPGNSARSPGTDVGLEEGKVLGKPMFTASGPEDVPEIIRWISSLPEGTELCIGGPRASECPDVYSMTKAILGQIWEGTTMDFMELAKGRYSVRAFTDKAVEQEKLDKIIEAGMIAPTAKNLQPVRIYIMKSAEAMEKMNALTRCIYGAPTALLVCYNEKEAWHSPYNEEYDAGEMDASIILTHMMLEAWELGIGSCWVGLFDHDEAAEAFGLPDEIKPVAIMPLGYAAAGPSPRHTEYRDRKELVTEL